MIHFGTLPESISLSNNVDRPSIVVCIGFARRVPTTDVAIAVFGGITDNFWLLSFFSSVLLHSIYQS
ncbi:hypothetical protein Q5689_17480 [Microcoleus sp. ARI1-A2]|uniref:hypothetical protein n=1 Tax=unclassified Microcoleus TaxID=2642155 RepID=UPI002FD0CCCC